MSFLKSRKGNAFNIIITLFAIIFLIISFPTTGNIEDIPKNSQFGNSLKQVAEISSKSIAHTEYINSLSKRLTESYLELYLNSYASKCIEDGEYFFLDQSSENSCFNNISSSTEEISNSFIKSIQNEFSSFDNLLDSDDVDVSFSIDLDSNSLFVESDYLGSLDFSSIEYTQRKEINIDLSQELLLLSTLKENIELLSERLQYDLPTCTNTGVSKDICVTVISKKYLLTNLERYDFSINYEGRDDFFILDVKVLNIQNENTLLSFSMKFEDIVPFYHITFEVEPYTLQNNIVKVSIDKPKEDEKNLHGFIVLYSYTNFFDSSSPGYSELISSLTEKQKIPNDFEDVISPYSENQGIQLRRSAESSPFDLTAAFIPADENSQDKTNLLLHQIYDKSRGAYNKLETNRDIFVYVFAVDKSYSYYVDEEYFTSEIESVEVKKMLPPYPLTESMVSILEVPELQKGIAFSINGYVDEDFSSYLIYLCSRRTSFSFSTDNNCEEIISPSLSRISGDFILHGLGEDTSFLNSYPGFNSLQSKNNFSQNEYFLYILPQNVEGDYISSQRNLQYELTQNADSTLDYYTFKKYGSGVLSSFLKPYFIRFE